MNGQTRRRNSDLRKIESEMRKIECTKRLDYPTMTMSGILRDWDLCLY